MRNPTSWLLKESEAIGIRMRLPEREYAQRRIDHNLRGRIGNSKINGIA
jgi:hypothetical protein